MQRIRIQFAWGEGLKFLSHLDLMRIWERTLRRANLPVAHSEGFNPHPKISMGIPLSVGMTSESEFMDVHFERWINVNALKEKLNSFLPKGMKVLAVRLISPKASSLTSTINAAVYSVGVSSNSFSLDIRSLNLAKDELLKKKEIIMARETKLGKKVINLRSMIFWLKIKDKENLEMCLQVGEKGTARPEEVVKALGLPLEIKFINRDFLFVKRGEEFISPI